jgi:hypothetical protein
MNALIELVLVLFWSGFLGLNLWLWKADVLEHTTTDPRRHDETDMKQGEPHATCHH